jgi:hypothetical protein
MEFLQSLVQPRFSITSPVLPDAKVLLEKHQEVVKCMYTYANPNGALHGFEISSHSDPRSGLTLKVTLEYQIESFQKIEELVDRIYEIILND